MKKLWIVILSGWLVTLGAGIVQAQSGYDLFQKALAKERAEGNIREAIQLYQRIVREHAVNRTLAAKALVAMGQCYEKLGKAEARRAYERVVKEFADQAEQASEARTRLAALSPPPGRTNGSAMVARRVWAGQDVDVLGQPSPDGRYVSYVDWETGDLAVRDLATGEKRRLTNKGSWSESTEMALFSSVSPDGRQVAFDWFNKEFFWDLRIVSFDGGPDGSKPRVLYRNEETEYLQTTAWSPDGKHVLTTLFRKDKTNQIVMVSVADGSVRVLKTLDWRYPMKMSFSPDGRYIVYDFPPKEELPARDIFLLSTDGSREIPLVQHQADDQVPFWTPDGKRVVFTSDRTGTTGLWAIQVADGRPHGAPELLKPDIGRALPMGFTRKGSFYYALDIGLQDVYLATLDMATGKLVGPPAPASQRFVGSNSTPDWSPDGQYLAYLSQRASFSQGPGFKFIVIRSLKTGEEREVSPKLNRFGRPRWSPDGRSFIVTGRDNKGRQGFYRIDAYTGDSTPLLQGEPGVNLQRSVLSPEGKAIFYQSNDRKSFSIRVRDLETGADTELYHTAGMPSFFRNLALSPDGRQLAFTTKHSPEQMDVLMVMPAAGGEPRELLRAMEPEIFQLEALAWTPNGRELLFVKRESDGPQQKGALWRIPAEGGTPQKLELAMDRLRDLRAHPDGKRIAFTAGQSKAEVWVLENFLPVLRAAK